VDGSSKLNIIGECFTFLHRRKFGVSDRNLTVVSGELLALAMREIGFF
jgi:hypothetical protein